MREREISNHTIDKVTKAKITLENYYSLTLYHSMRNENTGRKCEIERERERDGGERERGISDHTIDKVTKAKVTLVNYYSLTLYHSMRKENTGRKSEKERERDRDRERERSVTTR